MFNINNFNLVFYFQYNYLNIPLSKLSNYIKKRRKLLIVVI